MMRTQFIMPGDRAHEWSERAQPLLWTATWRANGQRIAVGFRKDVFDRVLEHARSQAGRQKGSTAEKIEVVGTEHDVRQEHLTEDHMILWIYVNMRRNGELHHAIWPYTLERFPACGVVSEDLQQRRLSSTLL